MSHRDPDRVLRAGWDGGLLVFVLFALLPFFAAIGLGGLLGLMTEHGPAAAVSLGFGAEGWLLWRCFTARFEADERNVTIRNLVRTVRVPRSSFEYATARSVLRWNMPPVIIAVVRRDEGPRLRRVSITCSTQLRSSRRQEFVDLIHDLGDTDDDFSIYVVQ